MATFTQRACMKVAMLQSAQGEPMTSRVRCRSFAFPTGDQVFTSACSR
jgi:hypothetical protein